MKSKYAINFLLATVLFISASSCYRMPGEDEYCVVPRTNNPDLVRAKPKLAPTPGVEY